MNRWKSAPSFVFGTLATAALATAVAQPANAVEKQIAAVRAPGVTYLNGGVTSDDERHMHRIAHEWPLRMEFSERKDNEFVADVNLKVADTHGKTYLELKGTGPMTFAKLPAGTYRITADFHGLPETRLVNLDGNGGRDLYFHWKGAVKHDPFTGKAVGGLEVPG